MIILISPAKKLDFDTQINLKSTGTPYFNEEAEQIAAFMKKYSAEDIAKLMSLSTQLSRLNFERYQSWNDASTPIRPALFAFKGDVYQGLEATTLSSEDLDFAQNHLRMLSGIYGYLRPTDLIKPHRLEMGTKLPFDGNADLYAFWKTRITKRINEELEALKNPLLINLASNEYASAVDLKQINADIITPEFKDFKNGTYKIISFYAKRARGKMSSFLIKNRITNALDIAAFNDDGYSYNNQLSTEKKPVFTRG